MSHSQVMRALFDIMPSQIQRDFASSPPDEMMYMSETEASSVGEEGDNTAYVSETEASSVVEEGNNTAYVSETESSSVGEEGNNTAYNEQDKDSESEPEEDMLKVCMSCLISNALLTVHTEEEQRDTTPVEAHEDVGRGGMSFDVV